MKSEVIKQVTQLTPRLVFSLCIAVFFSLLSWRAGALNYPVFFIAFWVAALAITLSGELILGAIHAETLTAHLPAALITGMVAFSLAMLPVVFLFDVSASTAFLVCCLFSGIGFIAFGRYIPKKLDTTCWIDIAVTGLATVFIVWFARQLAHTLPLLEVTGSASFWSDYFVHGAHIAQFGDALAVGRKDILFADQPRVFYHYSFYMLPAAVLGLTHLPGLAGATAILLPLGLLAALIGVYLLATELGGHMAGIVSVVLVACLPDGSQYLLRNGFFGFHWLMFTAPGSGYGMAVAMLTGALAIRWQRFGGWRLPLAVALFLMAILMFRAHILLLFAPALLGVAVLTRWQRHQGKIVVAVLGLLVVVAFLLLTVPDIRHFWLEMGRPLEFLANVHKDMEPTAYTGFYARILKHYGEGAAIMAGCLLLPFAAMGFAFLPYAVVQFVLWRMKRLRVRDWFPALLLLTFFLLVLFSPMPSNKDLTEYKHRHFVFLYVILLIWPVTQLAACRTCVIDSEKQSRRGHFVSDTPPLIPQPDAPPQVSANHSPGVRRDVLWVLGGGALCLFLTMGVFRDFDPGNSRLSWSGKFYTGRVPRGIPQASAHMRLHSAKGDTFLVIGDKGDDDALALATQVASLTDIPAYLAAGVQTSRGALKTNTGKRRLAVAHEIAGSETHERAVKLGRAVGIRWLLVVGTAAPKWNMPETEAAMYSGSVALYDFGGSR